MPCIICDEFDLKTKTGWVKKILITDNTNKTIFYGEFDLNNLDLLRLMKRYCKRVYNKYMKELQQNDQAKRKEKK